MKTYDAGTIRNVLLAGHSGAGKTSIAEALLFASGAITRMGKVDDGNTTTDHEPEEVKRGISVSLTLAPVEWDGVKINLLDAPGYADFTGDLRGAVRAADAVVVVVSAVDGVEVQTEAAWEAAVEAGLPRAIVINKLDRERASFERTLDELVKSFGTQVGPVQFPIGEEHEFSGVTDLLSRRAYSYGGADGRGTEGDWPDDIAGKADPYREKLAEAVAEADDSLLEKYLETGELSQDEIVRGMKAGFSEGRFTPVLLSAATHSVGVDRLAAFIHDVFPSPVDRGPVTVTKKDDSTDERACDPNGPFTAQVFKTLSDPYVGRISMFRVWSGRLRPDSSIHNASRGGEERVGQLFTLRGKDHETVSEIPAGDIGAVAKLQHAHTGDTFTTKGDDAVLAAIDLPEPLYAVAVEPKTKGDEDKLSTAFQRLQEEDPSFHVERSAETHETVIYGMGETHIDVMLERMKRKFGVEVVTRPAKIAYKMTVKAPAKAQGRYVKQSGGHGQFGVAWIEISPLGHGEGYEFVDSIVGGVIPHQFIPSVDKGVQKAMAEGAVAGIPVVDVKVNLYDGKAHSVDSSDMSFQIAGSMALREALNAAGIVLLEPVVELEVLVPDSMTGDIMGDLNSKRGKIAGMEPTGTGKTRVRALVPQAEVSRYSIDLRSITGGRGGFSMRFSHYEEVPAHLAQKIVDEAEKAKADAAAAKH
jgi:elongation factor G